VRQLVPPDLQHRLPPATPPPRAPPFAPARGGEAARAAQAPPQRLARAGAAPGEAGRTGQEGALRELLARFCERQDPEAIDRVAVRQPSATPRLPCRS
jgi:hypothetical protein